MASYVSELYITFVIYKPYLAGCVLMLETHFSAKAKYYTWKLGELHNLNALLSDRSQQSLNQTKLATQRRMFTFQMTIKQTPSVDHWPSSIPEQSWYKRLKNEKDEFSFDSPHIDLSTFNILTTRQHIVWCVGVTLLNIAYCIFICKLALNLCLCVCVTLRSESRTHGSFVVFIEPMWIKHQHNQHKEVNASSHYLVSIRRDQERTAFLLIVIIE